MTPEIPLWSGSSLDNAECLNYVKAVAAKVNELDPDALRVRRQIGLLDELIPRFEDFVNEGRAYSETSSIAAADADRDELFLSFWNAWLHMSRLGETNALGQAARTLTPTLTPYKGINRHSITKETEEIKGLREDLGKTPAVRDAVTAMGLTNILNALYQVNDAVDAAYSQRDSSRAGRYETQGDDTTESLRKTAVNLVLEIFRRINALNELEPSTDGQVAAQQLAAIVEQRKDVAVSRKPKKEPVPPDAPENAPAQA